MSALPCLPDNIAEMGHMACNVATQATCAGPWMPREDGQQQNSKQQKALSLSRCRHLSIRLPILGGNKMHSPLHAIVCHIAPGWTFLALGLGCWRQRAHDHDIRVQQDFFAQGIAAPPTSTQPPITASVVHYLYGQILEQTNLQKTDDVSFSPMFRPAACSTLTISMYVSMYLYSRLDYCNCVRHSFFGAATAPNVSSKQHD